MARYIEAKCRICRREGEKLFLKGDRCLSAKCPIEKKGAIPPGMHGKKGMRRLSSYGQQLREKQKAKRTYGILERQLRRYFTKARKAKGATGEILLRSLETRLDNVVYRLGFALSRSVARHFVNYGHVLVDGKRVDIASYEVKPGQTITLKSTSFEIPDIKKSVEKKENVPLWLERKGGVGRVVRLPKREDIAFTINEKLIVEFYSR